jgi:hypothetical protein
MNKQRKLILIAAAIGIISTFLPWFTISAGAFGYNIKQSQNGFHGIGILYFLLLIAVGTIAVVGEQKERLQKNMRLAVIGAGALAVICMLIGYGNIADTSSNGMGMVEAGVGYGFVLSFLAALVVTAIPFIIKDPEESLTSDIANFKSTVRSMQNTVITATAPKYPSNADQPIKTSAPVPDRMEELEKLIELRNSGKISAAEYEELKAKLF